MKNLMKYAITSSIPLELQMLYLKISRLGLLMPCSGMYYTQVWVHEQIKG